MERQDGRASPAAFFDESTFWPPLLPRMLTKPRTVCFCQPVASTISARVTPLVRFIIAITSAFLLLRASVAPFFARGALAAFARLAPFLALGAPFFRLAPFFEGAFAGATCAPCSATMAALSLVSSVFMVNRPFLRGLRA